MTTTALGCRKVIDENGHLVIRCGDTDEETREHGYMPFLCRDCFAATKPWHADACSVGFGGDCTCGAQSVISDGGRCEDEALS